MPLGATPQDAVGAFFDQPAYPIQWQDVEYLWAELLVNNSDNAHYGDYDRVYVETLRGTLGGWAASLIIRERHAPSTVSYPSAAGFPTVGRTLVEAGASLGG